MINLEQWVKCPPLKGEANAESWGMTIVINNGQITEFISTSIIPHCLLQRGTLYNKLMVKVTI